MARNETAALLPSPLVGHLVGEGGENERSEFETGEGWLQNEESAPHPPSLREGTLSDKGTEERNSAVLFA